MRGCTGYPPLSLAASCSAMVLFLLSFSMRILTHADGNYTLKINVWLKGIVRILTRADGNYTTQGAILTFLSVRILRYCIAFPSLSGIAPNIWLTNHVPSFFILPSKPGQRKRIAFKNITGATQ